MGCGSSKDPVVDMKTATEENPEELDIREETGDLKEKG